MTTAADVAARLDRLPVTPLHVLVAGLCGFGLLIDVAELALNGALTVIFSAPPNRMEPFSLGVLIASVSLGGAVGAPLLGLLADRYGRRTALQVSLFVVALPSFAAAFSQDETALILSRFVSGVALGAYPPLMTAFLADILPPKRRAMIILLADSFGLLGWPAVIVLVHWLTPLTPLGLDGWRWSLVIGGGLALLGALLFVFIPDSPRWLAVTGRGYAAERNCQRFERSAQTAGGGTVHRRATASRSPGTAEPELTIGMDGAEIAVQQGLRPMPDTTGYWRRVALIAAVYLLRAWSTLGFPLVSGVILIGKGWDVGNSLMFIGIAGFGSSIGALLAATFADRMERRVTLTLLSFAMTGFGLAFVVGDSAIALVIAATGFNLVSSMYGPLVSIYAAELFPTAHRASAMATAWSANRVGSALTPLLLLPLVHAAGPMAALSTIVAGLFGILVLILAFGPRGLAGRSILA